LNGKAQLADDTPFFKVFASTDTSVPQRSEDLSKAKQLLRQAGKAGGFTVPLASWHGAGSAEIPDLAQVVKRSAQDIGVTINLNLTDPKTYYGEAKFGTSPLLDSVMGITDYGHRGV